MKAIETNPKLIKAAKHYGAMLGLLQHDVINKKEVEKHRAKARKMMLDLFPNNY
jgi:hypothetical protein